MNITLISFQYIPNSEHGWTSKKITFGENFTLIMGENGSGKTPLMKGIGHALGLHVSIPQQIIDRCSHTKLEISINKIKYTLQRKLVGKSAPEVSENDGPFKTFENEDLFSVWVFEKLNLKREQLTVRGNIPNPAYPYAHHLFRCLWIDQDEGWTSTYWSPHNFLKDQHEEMLRLLFDLPPRWPYNRKALFEKAKKDEKKAEGLVEIKRELVEVLLKETSPYSSKDIKQLQEKKLLIEKELDSLNSDMTSVFAISRRYTDEINEIDRKISELTNLKLSADARIESARSTMDEIEAEIEALGANDDAAREFRKFCGVEHCGLFLKQEESYGKSLYYLKDQIKDISGDNSELLEEKVNIEHQIEELNEKRKILENSKNQVTGEPSTKKLTQTIGHLSTEISDIEKVLKKLSSVAAAQKELEEVIGQLRKIEASKEELKGDSRTERSLREVEAVSLFRKNIEKWLKSLNTQNLTYPITVDSSFNLFFGDREFKVGSQESGSTRTRIVLAYHAAALETSLTLEGNHPSFLVFDSPRQHELSESDFNSYMNSLRELMTEKSKNIQLVISFKEMNFNATDSDKVYWPEFKNEKNELRHLGPVKG